MSDTRGPAARRTAPARRHAPGGTLLAEQIIAAARTRPQDASRRRGWPTWTLPLLAAGAVAAIVTGVFVGVAQIRDSADPDRGRCSNSHESVAADRLAGPDHRAHARPSRTVRIARRSPSRSAESATRGSRSAPTSRSATSRSTAPRTPGRSAPPTASQVPAPAPAMVRTTDGGAHWTSMPTPPGRRHRYPLRDRRSRLRLQRLRPGDDHGRRRDLDRPQAGGALALETLDGNVIRVISTATGCPGPCSLAVEYAPLGSPDWSSATVATSPPGERRQRVDLVRSDSDAYVLVTGHSAGGAQSATSTLFASTDDGRTGPTAASRAPRTARGRTGSTARRSRPRRAVSVTVLCGYRGQRRPHRRHLDRPAARASATRRAPSRWTRATSSPAIRRPCSSSADARGYRSDDGGDSWSGTPRSRTPRPSSGSSRRPSAAS